MPTAPLGPLLVGLGLKSLATRHVSLTLHPPLYQRLMPCAPLHARGSSIRSRRGPDLVRILIQCIDDEELVHFFTSFLVYDIPALIIRLVQYKFFSRRRSLASVEPLDRARHCPQTATARRDLFFSILCLLFGLSLRCLHLKPTSSC